jgi:hypothetical protein
MDALDLCFWCFALIYGCLLLNIHPCNGQDCAFKQLFWIDAIESSKNIRENILGGQFTKEKGKSSEPSMLIFLGMVVQFIKDMWDFSDGADWDVIDGEKKAASKDILPDVLDIQAEDHATMQSIFSLCLDTWHT